MKTTLTILLLYPSFLLLISQLPTRAAADHPNVLFLAIDDLRNTLGSLGATPVKTPHLDSLAADARMFSHHYTQVPTCGASRCTLLRGRYPEQPVHLSNAAIANTYGQWAERSLPGWFRTHGYRTLALGKITHYPGGRTGHLWSEGPEEFPGVWDHCWIPKTPWDAAKNIMHGYANGTPRTPGESPPWEAFDGPDDAYPDAWIARGAIATLHRLTQAEQPWFLAVGFFKPHLPFAAPKKWFDLYSPESFPEPPVPDRPRGTSSWHSSGEFRGNYGHAGRDPSTDADYARRMRLAYAAATSYMDAQVGRVLATLRDLRLERNTIVVVWSDHGFLLGEHAIWGKHCLYENALRSPLTIRKPGLNRPGIVSQATVETVDIFPTLTDLCGLPTPDGLHGRSLRPQIDDPNAPASKPAHGFWKRTQRTLRTERWRLIAHESPDGTVRALELFDYDTDPFESRNVADTHPEVTANLLEQLRRAPNPGVTRDGPAH